MRTFGGLFAFWLALAGWAVLGGGGGCASSPQPVHEALGRANFTSPQVDPIVVSADGQRVYVANTTSASVSILATAPLQLVRTALVGLEPVSLALRPGGLELWVSNHVSDSVSVVDVDPSSASYGQVIETIQSLDENGVTRFDEPTGIAFAGASKAYVALSSRNQIAIVDADSYQVTGFLDVRAQEPRAMAVHDGKLYVAAFESGNRSQLSACLAIDPPDCTLDLADLFDFATDPNLPGETKNIVKHISAPNRDVFIFDTATDLEDGAISHLSTLLYGLTVSADGTLYVTATDARNTVNGLHGQTLADLDGLMFDNELLILSACSCDGSLNCTCTRSTRNLEPVPTTHATSRAVPYAVATSADGTSVLVTSAGANRLLSLDAAGNELDVLDVGANPKGVAFHAPSGPAGTAYVLNTLGNSVTQVSVDASGQLAALDTVGVGTDTTPAAVRRGNIAFNNAFASTTGNHSCGSCHPDGNTDQLLWRIGGACEDIGCDPGDEPRTTMPVRGLKDTLPLHWDGTLGDPFGGGNGAVGLNGTPDPSSACTLGDADGDHDCFLGLVQASLAGVMCDQSGPCPNTGLSAVDQDDMATFLASVSYPPARSRRIDDTLSDGDDPADLNGIVTSARQGFADFFTDVDGSGQPRTCADADGGCHALPLGVSTNSATLAGFDAPTMRGLSDRFLQFSLGPTNTQAVLQVANLGGSLGGDTIDPLEPGIEWDPSIGFREVTTFGAAFLVFQPVYGMRPPDLWQMVEEASTGFSGAIGRQVTLNTTTAALPETAALLAALEAADARGVVNLRGTLFRGGSAKPISYANGAYKIQNEASLSSAELLAEAQAGTSLVTLTAALRQNVGALAQPLLSTTGAIGNGLIGDPPLPQLASGHPAFTLTGRHVSSAAAVLVDGLPVGATLACDDGVTNGVCNEGAVTIDLAARPSPDGLHLLQVQNPRGLLSNELPICVAPNNNLEACISD